MVAIAVFILEVGCSLVMILIVLDKALNDEKEYLHSRVSSWIDMEFSR